VALLTQTKNNNMEDILSKVNADRAVFNGLGNIYPADGSVEISAEPIEGVTCYWFAPDSFDENKIIIYLHGGMFVLGSIETYKPMVSYFASAFSAKILFIEYGLAPEKPFPNGVNDVLKVYRELIRRYPDAKITLMGDSAGGALSATLIKMASEEKLGMPSCVVMLSPWVYLRGNTESYETRKKLDTILTKDKLMEYQVITLRIIGMRQIQVNLPLIASPLCSFWLAVMKYFLTTQNYSTKKLNHCSLTRK